MGGDDRMCGPAPRRCSFHVSCTFALPEVVVPAEATALVMVVVMALLAAESDLLADLPARERKRLAGLLRSLLAPFA